MEEHGTNQSDLKEIGSQGVVSEILNGKRKLFDLANLFLDSWFGIERVFDQVLPKDGDSDQINPDIPEKIPSIFFECNRWFLKNFSD